MDLREARWAESVEAEHRTQSATSGIAPSLGITAAPVRLDSQTKYAGALIVRKARGRVSDALGRPLDFRAGRRLERNHGIVATSASARRR